ncbi:GNAT family N-acetyltransferase [Nocardiopsis halophila]|uniref:GNAT family N-acetyltransferase n=1 Tax=Nocardiopsis halophila TaxID=141692 RepID=UPI00034C4923|nr:GNAT family N-acetyltransferase [Nocardiopsis halophila]
MTAETLPGVRDALPTDVAAMVALGGRVPGTEPVETRRARLGALVSDPRAVVLVATDEEVVQGFLAAAVGDPAPVHGGVGPVGYVDDLAVGEGFDWWRVGGALIARARERLKEAGAVRMIVTTGGGHPVKQAFLWRSGLTLVTESYEQPLS